MRTLTAGRWVRIIVAAAVLSTFGGNDLSPVSQRSVGQLREDLVQYELFEEE